MVRRIVHNLLYNSNICERGVINNDRQGRDGVLIRRADHEFESVNGVKDETGASYLGKRHARGRVNVWTSDKRKDYQFEGV